MKKKSPNYNDPSLKAYLNEIGQFPLLDRDEEVSLARKIQAGDADAREKMVNSNLRLVVKVATSFGGMGLDLPDLIAEGNLGLMAAAERFDPDRGVRFSTYAVHWIKQRIRRALSNQGRTIRIPVGVIADGAKMRRAESKLGENLEREPSADELAETTGFAAEKVKRLRTLPIACMSLDAPPNQTDDDLSLAEIIADEEAAAPEAQVAEQWDSEFIKQALPALDDRERTIIERRFGLDGKEPEFLSDLGKRLKITSERVRQIQSACLEKLRVHLCQMDTGFAPALAS